MKCQRCGYDKPPDSLYNGVCYHCLAEEHEEDDYDEKPEEGID